MAVPPGRDFTRFFGKLPAGRQSAKIQKNQGPETLSEHKRNDNSLLAETKPLS